MGFSFSVSSWECAFFYIFEVLYGVFWGIDVLLAFSFGEGFVSRFLDMVLSEGGLFSSRNKSRNT